MNIPDEEKKWTRTMNRETLKRIERVMGAGVNADEPIHQVLQQNFDMIPHDPASVLDVLQRLMPEQLRSPHDWQTFILGICYGLTAYEYFGRMTPAQFENYLAPIEATYNALQKGK